MFNVDVDAVPGKCPNHTNVSPGAAPQSPTQQELAVRDRLIADQEAHLNIYRCRFDIDIQLVPGACATQPDPRPTVQPAAAFTAISAGWLHSCGIRADQTAVCWGDNEWTKADAPPGQFIAISAGWLHSCGIRADHTAVCWGLYHEGHADAPAGQVHRHLSRRRAFVRDQNRPHRRVLGPGGGSASRRLLGQLSPGTSAATRLRK